MNRFILPYCITVVGWFLLFISTPGASQSITFTNVANQMGINHIYSGQFLGGGVSFCDMNNNGLEDISLTSGSGEIIAIYSNHVQSFTNIAPQLNLSDSAESEMITWVDTDNDGDRDLLVTNFMGPTKLYRNDGNYVFVDITASANLPTDTLPTTAACWGDYDNDGFLDLYLCNYSYVNNLPAVPNMLFRNNGDGTFTDVTATADVADSTRQPLAVVFLDYNNDGWQDIYIANDKRNGNTLFRNNGDGTFSDVSAESHSDLAFDAMGLAVGDYDNNGYPDIYVSNGEEGNGLLRNNGDGTFTEVADSAGVAVNRVCWGANFFDFDNDGDLDLYVSVSHGTVDHENALFENLGDGTFSRVSGAMIGGDEYQSFGNAIGDFNNDGYCDIAVLNINDPFVLWENSGGSNNWIKLQLEGTISNREGIGSIVEIYRNGEKFIRSTHCGISYLSQNSSILTIGVGESDIVDHLVVKWPSGSVSVLSAVGVNQTLTITEQPHQFNNFAPIVGIDHTYEPGLENSLGGGVAFGDFDNDGWEDLVIATGDSFPLALYRNNRGIFEDVTPASGITTSNEAKTVSWGDYDNDGDNDLFIANFGSSNKLYRNEGGGVFTDVTFSSGLQDSMQSTAAVWVDYNNDGWLDIYVCNYGNVNNAGEEPNVLYKNNGNGSFNDVTQQAGLSGAVGKKPLAMVFFDYDNDGWQDVYIANDKEQGNELFRNNGDGTFSDVTVSSGTGAHMDAMGLAVADYDRDGFFDIYISNGTQGNVFYHNNGDGTFTDVAPQLGITVNRECWGANFADFDNDGFVDLFIAVASGVNRQDVLFKGDGTGFTDISDSVGIVDESFGFGSAVADFDNDGASDIFVVNRFFNTGEKSFLYKNALPQGRWLKVQLEGSNSNRNGIGARVEVVANGALQIQEVRGGSSYLSQNSLTLTFGLGNLVHADSVIVAWPSGIQTVLTNVAANQKLIIMENPTGIAEQNPNPQQFVLYQNYPNPFNPGTTITFDISHHSLITLHVYDITGRKVRTLINGRLPAGSHEVLWDGRDDTGQWVASGVYIYRLQAGKFSQSRKMLLLR